VIQVFKPLPVAHTVGRSDDLPAATASSEHQNVTLGWEDRLKVRARRVSDRGFEFATALERGTVLRAGDCFVFDTPPIVVHVIERAEPVLVVRPETPVEWALYAYHIGNSHQPMMLESDAIVCADVAGMAQVLNYHQIPFVRDHRPFTPISQLADHRHQVAR
jgi:urease accessory protein